MRTYVFTLPPFFAEAGDLKWAIPLLYARAVLMASCDINAQAYIPESIYLEDNFQTLVDLWKGLGLKVSVTHSVPSDGEIFPYSFDARTLESVGLLERVTPGADLDKGNLYELARPKSNPSHFVFDIPKPRGRLALRRRDVPVAELQLRREGVRRFVCGPKDGASGAGIYKSMLPTAWPKFPRKGTLVMESLDIASGGFLGIEKSLSCQYNGRLLGATWQLLNGTKWAGNILCPEIPDRVQKSMESYISQLPAESKRAGGVDWVAKKCSPDEYLGLDLNLNRITGAHPAYALAEALGTDGVWGQKMFKPQQSLDEFVESSRMSIDEALVVPMYWSKTIAMVFCVGDSVWNTYNRLSFFSKKRVPDRRRIYV